ncbi:PGF-CTERM sorting domain-containing protein [Haloarcula halophila]|uniref:PGF-CTERM sorting domain-containing protein n=1 Tax=Haloarcula TaxID=2237 RepID=UPI0023E35D85|nr:PGF-CTERM sorting domain-containing protein [Halomicroarcula sp. DFY41]
MDGVRRWTIAAGLTALLVLVAFVPVASATPSQAGAVDAAGASSGGTVGSPEDPQVGSRDGTATEQVADSETITVNQSFALTANDSGSVDVRLRYAIPDRVRSLETTLPENATVTRTTGFTRVNGTTYEWDGESATPTLAYRRNPNETLDRSGPESAAGRYVGVDAGEWALFTRSATPTEWTYVGTTPVTFRRDIHTVGPGAAGEWVVYLGTGTTTERTANDQTIRLVVPDRASMADSPDSVLSSLSNASNALRVGDRDEHVFVVAAPTGTNVTWGARGYQVGDADMWVKDDERLDTAENIWLHEYVHSRQAFRPTSRTRWLVESSAVYYAAALTLEQDRIDFDAYRSRLGAGADPVYDGIILAAPSTWEESADYYRGPLVAGRIDERIRLSTNDERTFQDTMRLLNGRERPVTQANLLSAVERAGGEQARTLAANYTGSTATVRMWNESRHAAVFGQLPARIGYALPAADNRSAYRVDGQYRDGPVGGEIPLQLVVGETLTVDAIVRNAGGTEGQYNATMDINGTTVTTAGGRIAPTTTRVVPLSHTFVTPGQYTLSLDGTNVTVLVQRPARAEVTDIAVSSRSARAGTEVVVTATVTNTADIPAAGRVVFTRDFERVTDRQVYLPPRNSTELSTGIRLPEPGDVLVAAGSADPVTITVTPAATTESTPTPTPTPVSGTTTPRTTSADGPGFTVALAVLALALGTLVASRRR